MCIVHIGFLGVAMSDKEEAMLGGTKGKTTTKYASSCTVPSWPAVLHYKIPNPPETSSTRGSGFQGNKRDHCDDLVSATSSCCPSPFGLFTSEADKALLSQRVCPCSTCTRFNIRYSKEKAETIAVTRATERYLAVCRNARICVGGLRDTSRFRYFRADTCERWAGGDVTSCVLEVSVKSTKIPGGWRVQIRATIADQQWTIPVKGLMPLDRRFRPVGPKINIADMTVHQLEIAAHAAPMQRLVVGRGLADDVLSFDIGCDEVARGYPIDSGVPSLPEFVTRKSKLETAEASRKRVTEAHAKASKDNSNPAPYLGVYRRFDKTLVLNEPDKERTIDSAISEIIRVGDSIGVPGARV